MPIPAVGSGRGLDSATFVVKGIKVQQFKKTTFLKREQHTRTLLYESEPMSMLEVYSKTPLGKALVNSEQADRDNVGEGN